MGFLSAILGGATAAPIEAVGNVFDKLFTSDEERLSKDILKQRLVQQPMIAQTEINKVEANHRSIFVAGWRPFIGWTCGLGLFNQVIIRPYVEFFYNISLPTISDKLLFDLVIALLGLGTLRTIEKFGGRTK